MVDKIFDRNLFWLKKKWSIFFRSIFFSINFFFPTNFFSTNFFFDQFFFSIKPFFDFFFRPTLFRSSFFRSKESETHQFSRSLASSLRKVWSSTFIYPHLEVFLRVRGISCLGVLKNHEFPEKSLDILVPTLWTAS